MPSKQGTWRLQLIFWLRSNRLLLLFTGRDQTGFFIPFSLSSFFLPSSYPTPSFSFFSFFMVLGIEPTRDSWVLLSPLITYFLLELQNHGLPSSLFSAYFSLVKPVCPISSSPSLHCLLEPFSPQHPLCTFVSPISDYSLSPNASFPSMACFQVSAFHVYFVLNMQKIWS